MPHTPYLYKTPLHSTFLKSALYTKNAAKNADVADTNMTKNYTRPRQVQKLSRHHEFLRILCSVICYVMNIAYEMRTFGERCSHVR